MRSRTLLGAFLCAALPVSYATAWGAEAVAEAQGTGSVPAQSQDAARPGLGSDIKAYFTAPLRWSGAEWAIFGGVLVAIGAAHHYDSKVRDHFVTPNQVTDTKDLQDALPAVAVVGATWAYAALVDSSAGRSETWNMVEAAALSAVPAYALKFAAGREGPYQTTDPNQWGKGAGTFPSFHATAAFAVGTVLAESGNDEFRWERRLLGYGLGTVTAYERLNHNAHWFSDVVAGAALGVASGYFVLGRSRERAVGNSAHLGVLPMPGGLMLTYSTTLP